jgi:hypothetical protein
MIYIYGLYESGQTVSDIRYIGQSVNPQSRLGDHRCDDACTTKAEWIRSLRKNNKTVNMIILDSATDKAQANAKENAWILFGKRCGWTLVNGTSPGGHRDIFSADMISLEQAFTNVEQQEAFAVINASEVAELEQKMHVLQSEHARIISDLNMQISRLSTDRAALQNVFDWEKQKLQRYNRWVKLAKEQREERSMMIDAYSAFVSAGFFIAAGLMVLYYINEPSAMPHDVMNALLVCTLLFSVPPLKRYVIEIIKGTTKDLRRIRKNYTERMRELDRKQKSYIVR